MGLDIYLGDNLEALDNEPEFSMNSAYLRSSYNEYGFNNAVPVLTGDSDATFNTVFSEVLDGAREEDGQYWLGAYSLEALRRAKDKALDVVQKIKAAEPIMAETINFASLGLSPNHNGVEFQETDTSALEPHDKAVNLYLREQEKHWTEDLQNEMPRYSRGQGIFWHDGLEVLAAIKTHYYGYPAVSLIYRQTEEWKQHYVMAAEAAVRFIARAISIIQTNKEVELDWSS